LPLTGVPEGDSADPGDIGCRVPDKSLVLYYGDVGFYNGIVRIGTFYNGTERSRMTGTLVRFTPGARTNWHAHAVGQTLHVTEGGGLVGIRDGTVSHIRAADTVVCPPPTPS
jgi:quercetin dioxygenase-like cupin family protein